MPHSPFPTTPALCEAAKAKISWPVAAPSFVRPAGIAENCAFLAGIVDEVGLCLFETEACLAYGPDDLPPGLAGLGLRFHVHLPLDLDWNDPPACWAAVKALVDMTAPLAPHAFVLHPDAAAPPQEIARQFRAMGIAPERVLLENIKGQTLTDLWPGIIAAGLGVCLDTGHILAYSQQPLLELEGLWQRVRMVHLSAPDPARPSRHAGLTQLDRDGRKLLHTVLENLHESATVMIEVFDEPGLMTSLDFLENTVNQMDGTQR